MSNEERAPKKVANAQYGQSDLEHLSDLEHVRERPSMYIGDTASRGLHHLVYEVVDNSIDEAMANYATEIRVADQHRMVRSPSKTTAVVSRSNGMSSSPNRWIATCRRSKAS